jgi:hypothetical protein
LPNHSVYSAAWPAVSGNASADAFTYVWQPGTSQRDFGAPNSVKITLHNSAGTTPPELALLDPADLPLPNGFKSLGLWGIQPAASGTIDLDVRYDSEALALAGGDPADVTLWGYNGQWELLGRPTAADANQFQVSGSGNGLQFFSVGIPEPGPLSLLALGAAGLLVRRRRR